MLTADVAELLGMHAGDGTLYKTASNSIVWELRGNHDEKEFYDWYVVPLLTRIGFPMTGHVRSGGKNGCYGVRSCDREFHKLLLDAGFGIGRKTHTVRIPTLVMEGSPEVKAAFLAGLFATDGSAYVSENRPYVELASVSEGLIEDACLLLLQAEVKHYAWTHKSKRWSDSHFIRISGKRRVRKFSDAIGFSNPKHFRRVEQFLKY